MNFQYEDITAKILSPATMEKVVEHIQDLIEEYSIEKYPAEHREHLGASIIGDACSRKSWYNFRWVKLEQHEGRMRRLFARGTNEEAQFIEILRGIGFLIHEVDPQTNKQFRIYGIQGHFGGSGDSKAVMPWLPDLPILLEFKTHNTKSFTYLVEKKLKIAKPQHYVQMCLYGRGYGFKYGLYCACNKNDDDLYFELVELDWNLAQQAENKAFDIITAKLPPPRISDQPSYFECKYCNYNDICHHGAPVEKNCRSCMHAIPIENAQWRCTRFDAIIPPEFISKGCEYHVSINT